MSTAAQTLMDRVMAIWPEDAFGNNVIRSKGGERIGYVCMMDAQDESPTVYVADITVYAQHRGRGHGSEILDQICRMADEEGVKLMLNVSSSGPMTDEDLEGWYGRRGFAFAEETPEIDGIPMSRPSTSSGPELSM